MSLQTNLWKFTIDHYHTMIEAGILTENDKVELINGNLIAMSPVGSKHIATVNMLVEMLYEKLLKKAIISVQSPVSLGRTSEPEPDITILRKVEDYYYEKTAGANDVLLLIEVSDTTLDFDRNEKARLYAKSGIQTYWIVNILDQVVEIYTQPENGQYKLRQLVLPNDLLEIPELKVHFAAREIWNRN